MMSTDGTAGGPPNPLRNRFNAIPDQFMASYLNRDIVGFDDSVDFMEVSFLEGFQGGPRTYTRIPDSSRPEEGSFENKTLAIKLAHCIGAKVVELSAVRRLATS